MGRPPFHFNKKQRARFLESLHLDIPLFLGILCLMSVGLLILYSASNQKISVVGSQAIHFALGIAIMIIFARIPPTTYQRWAPFIYGIGITLLLCVLIMGHINKGAKRWLIIGSFRLQPSEIMKLAIPMLLAWQCQYIHLPIRFKSLCYAAVIIAVPTLLTAKQPDLGTAILLLMSGASILFLAGLSIRVMIATGGIALISAPALWLMMHDYQKQRVLNFLNPERDVLGAGYHITQSKIAIGSGGLFGKGWLLGTQSHLHFLPENTTDFIFAVCSEELGLFGNLLLLSLFVAITLRGLYITVNAQDSFTRLLAGALTFTFFSSYIINMGMVTGIVPVVGVPLPLISYGGSSLVTLMASFGILMSIQTHRKLLTT